MRSLAYSRQWKKSWYMALFQLPGAGYLARANDFALIDRLWRDWSPGYTLPDAQRAELHACLAASMPAPLEFYRAILRPFTTLVDRVRKGQGKIRTPLLQLHGNDDGCIAPPTDDDARWFTERVLEVLPNLGHFLHVEAPELIGARVARWLA
jgi:pimeloyl-ACP methyl ester carboxylesterase